MTEMLKIPIIQLPHHEGLGLPAYATPGAAGMDLQAAISEEQILHPGHRLLVPTGIAIGLPKGYEAQVRPRSGLALRHGITVLNSPGTIDSDYRGEIKVLLINLGDESYTIERGSRIAQLVIAPFQQANWQPVESLEESLRGSGGFGHTGT